MWIFWSDNENQRCLLRSGWRETAFQGNENENWLRIWKWIGVNLANRSEVLGR